MAHEQEGPARIMCGLLLASAQAFKLAHQPRLKNMRNESPHELRQELWPLKCTEKDKIRVMERQRA